MTAASSIADARPDHLPALDGLRALAVLLVLWTHTPHALQHPTLVGWAAFVQPGYLGVDVFFVLSGFLITRILLSEKVRGVPLWKFMLRRAVRIFPAYYLLVGLVAAFAWTPDVPWCAVYLGNVYYPFYGHAGLLQHSWSLCVEEHFYLLWPPLVALLPGRASRWAALVAVVAGVGFAIWWSVTFAPGAPAWSQDGWIVERVAPGARARFADRAVQMGSPFRFVSLAAGCLLAFGEGGLRRLGVALGLAAVLFVVGSIGTATLWLQLVERGYVAAESLAPWLPWVPAMRLWAFACFSTAIVALGIGAGPSWLGAPLRLAPLRYVGRISYGLYLYHLPIFRLMLRETDEPWRVAPAWAVSFAAAIASYHLFEAPLLRWGRRWR